MLSAKALEEFKQLWREEFGEEISDEFAAEQAVKLLTLFDIVYRPIKSSFIPYSERSSASPL